ncbi:hypothetical protein CsatB_025122 [Cannabis sativa]
MRTSGTRLGAIAKYVPFNAGFNSSDSYSLEEIIYKCCPGGLLSVHHMAT